MKNEIYCTCVSKGINASVGVEWSVDGRCFIKSLWAVDWKSFKAARGFQARGFFLEGKSKFATIGNQQNRRLSVNRAQAPWHGATISVVDSKKICSKRRICDASQVRFVLPFAIDLHHLWEKSPKVPFRVLRCFHKNSHFHIFFPKKRWNISKHRTVQAPNVTPGTERVNVYNPERTANGWA